MKSKACSVFTISKCNEKPREIKRCKRNDIPSRNWIWDGKIVINSSMAWNPNEAVFWHSIVSSLHCGCVIELPRVVVKVTHCDVAHLIIVKDSVLFNGSRCHAFAIAIIVMTHFCRCSLDHFDMHCNCFFSYIYSLLWADCNQIFFMIPICILMF